MTRVSVFCIRRFCLVYSCRGCNTFFDTMNMLNLHKETAHKEGISYIKDPPPIVLPVRYVYILHQRPTTHRPICQICLYPTSKTHHPSSYLSGTFISYIKDPPPIILPIRYVYILHERPTACCSTSQVHLYRT